MIKPTSGDKDNVELLSFLDIAVSPVRLKLGTRAALHGITSDPDERYFDGSIGDRGEEATSSDGLRIDEAEEFNRPLKVCWADDWENADGKRELWHFFKLVVVSRFEGLGLCGVSTSDLCHVNVIYPPACSDLFRRK